MAGLRTRAHDTVKVMVLSPSGADALSVSAAGASVPLGVPVCDGVAVAVDVGVPLPVAVCDGVGVPLLVVVGVCVADAVPDGDCVPVGDDDGVTDGDGVPDGVRECVAPRE